MVKILRNSGKCRLCEGEVESVHVHDYKPCKCGAIAVDGGKEYLKRSGKVEDFIDTSITSGAPAQKKVKTTDEENT